jgi:prepilin-type N-terminal cleavage/methylation domain-containing protein
MSLFFSSKSKNSGFTLIELMVAISLFSTVMVIVIGALLALNNANRRAQAVRAVIDNLNFAMEDVTRNIRTSTDIECARNGISDDGRIRDPNNGAINCGSEPVHAIFVKGQLEQIDKVDTATCYFYIFDTESGTLRYSSRENVPSGRVDNSICSKAMIGSTYSGFISPEVVLGNMSFFVENFDPREGKRRSKVTINLNGDINLSEYSFTVPFNVQTTVSKR